MALEESAGVGGVTKAEKREFGKLLADLHQTQEALYEANRRLRAEELSMEQHWDRQSEVSERERVADRKSAALAKYGRHLGGCSLSAGDGDECSCGFHAAAGPSTPTPEPPIHQPAPKSPS